MNLENIPTVVRIASNGRLFVRISNVELGLGEDVEAEAEYVSHCSPAHIERSREPERGFKTHLAVGNEVRVSLLGPFTERGSRFISVKRVPHVGSRPTDPEIWAETLAPLEEKSA